MSSADRFGNVRSMAAMRPLCASRPCAADDGCWTQGQLPPLFQSPNGGRPAAGHVTVVDIPGFIPDGSSAAQPPSTVHPRLGNNPQQQQQQRNTVTNATADFALELVKPGKSCTNGSSSRQQGWRRPNAVNAPRPRRIAWVETSSSSVSGASANKLLEEPLPVLCTDVYPAAWLNDENIPDVEQSSQQWCTTPLIKTAAGPTAARRIAWPDLFDAAVNQPQCTPTTRAAAAVHPPQLRHPADTQQPEPPQTRILRKAAAGAAHPEPPPRRLPNKEPRPTTSSSQLQAATAGAAAHPGWLARLYRKAHPAAAGLLSKCPSSLAAAHGSECADADADDTDLDDPLTFILGSGLSRDDSLAQPVRPRPVWPSLLLADRNGASSSAAACPPPVRTEEDEDSDRYDAVTEAMLAACAALKAAATTGA
ncbi:hypothetical protein PLESTB_001548600 [Pleodorina starrii]|uniref:Uncharacterized protein n=1 Tax=Pleodorina starrii TaxID=330485 RepID=A0A9W6BX44_9CHLO|nr:hypothetical protein PLESTB_001548600 [Pleodorina starrii]